jgi:hypothetical protein
MARSGTSRPNQNRARPSRSTFSRHLPDNRVRQFTCSSRFEELVKLRAQGLVIALPTHAKLALRWRYQPGLATFAVVPHGFDSGKDPSSVIPQAPPLSAGRENTGTYGSLILAFGRDREQRSCAISFVRGVVTRYLIGFWGVGHGVTWRPRFAC